MQLEYGFKYTGTTDNFLITLTPATIGNKATTGIHSLPLFYVEIEAYGVKKAERKKVQQYKIEEVLTQYSLHMTDLSWRFESMEPVSVRPDIKQYEYSYPFNIVYFIEATGANRIRIGTTKSMTQRLIAATVMCPFPTLLLGYMKGSYEEEKQIQKKFMIAHRHNSWYEATPELRQFIAENCFKP